MDNPLFEMMDGLDESEGGAEASDALGEPGMGASWTPITFWRLEMVG
jgi:hypothetical protein